MQCLAMQSESCLGLKKVSDCDLHDDGQLTVSDQRLAKEQRQRGMTKFEPRQPRSSLRTSNGSTILVKHHSILDTFHIQLSQTSRFHCYSYGSKNGRHTCPYRPIRALYLQTLLLRSGQRQTLPTGINGPEDKAGGGALSAGQRARKRTFSAPSLCFRPTISFLKTNIKPL